MIVQGSNAPILLTFDNIMENVTDFSAVLVSRRLGDENKIIKQWTKDDIEIGGLDIILPLTQEETMEFPSGTHALEVKWVNEDNICFANVVNVNIEYRADKTKLNIGEV